jgi:hypothetical protein
MEEFLLALLLRYPALRSQAGALAPEEFWQAEHRALFEAWRSTPDIESLRLALPEELRPRLERLLAKDLPVYEGRALDEAFADCVRRLRWRRLSAAKRASTATLIELGLREEMSAVVERARRLREQPVGGPDTVLVTDPQARQEDPAIALVHDVELGRRLHQAATQRHQVQSDIDPPPSDERS